MSDLYSLDRFPIIIIIDLLSIEVLHKHTEND